ncbi:MAG: D-inositol-3-phosphate glycosyltransferase [Streptosporangiaceae bacterium]
MVSVHTSPLDQPGGGDAGGLNVYVVELAKRLARRGVNVEIFTRASSSGLPSTVQLAPGVLVRHVLAGPYGLLGKRELPPQLCAFTAEMLAAEAAREPGAYDLVHSHYWLSGQVGRLVAERWGVPLVHSMHTMAKVKNAVHVAGEIPEPPAREREEERIAVAADRLVASTGEEAAQLVALYGATADRVRVVPPGVDLSAYHPGPAAEARRRLGLASDAAVLLFVGRLQPHKAPDLLLRAAARLLTKDPALGRRLVVAVVGGPSGGDLGERARLGRLAADLGIESVVRFEDPGPSTWLADWYRAATATVVPSYSESFGLAALESQACGTPVVAASVGGLRTAVRDGLTGVLVERHDPAHYAEALRRLVTDPSWRSTLGGQAAAHAARFGWDTTAERITEVYTGAMAQKRSDSATAVSR